MTSPNQELTRLLRLALDKSVEGRRTLTASLGDLFSGNAAVLTERETALMSDILQKLLRDCEMAVRRDLAERLSKAENPPRDLIVALANDEIDVAQPILMKSSVLRDMELVQIVRRRTRQHQLAIAMRRAVSEPVSNALVETGDVNVIKALLENQDARISEATMTYLAEESRRVDTYQEPLIKRHDLNPELAKRMYLWVSAALRQHIIENFDVNPSDLDDNLEHVAGAISNDPSQDAERPAEVLARRLDDAEKISWDLLIQVLRQGEIPLFEALFGKLSRMSAARTSRVLYESGGESLAIACRALDMPKTAFATILLLSRRAEPGEKASNPRILAHMLTLFDKIDSKAAREVLKIWQRDEEYQNAIEAVADTPRAGPDS